MRQRDDQAEHTATNAGIHGQPEGVPGTEPGAERGHQFHITAAHAAECKVGEEEQEAEDPTRSGCLQSAEA